MISIDINCDLAEGMPNDLQLMPYISSANIACGFHAGSKEIMKATIGYAVKNNVAIGAHPGFNDKQNFGRKEIYCSDKEYYDLIIQQLQILQQELYNQGAKMHHVKPHGALYNMSAANENIAAIIANAVKAFDASLILYGLSNSCSIVEANKIGLQTASEVFADRTYSSQGKLTPRTNTNAVLTNTERVKEQVLQMVMQQSVISVHGVVIPLQAQTICIHGDGEHAVSFALAIHTFLKENDILITAL